MDSHLLMLKKYRVLCCILKFVSARIGSNIRDGLARSLKIEAIFLV